MARKISNIPKHDRNMEAVRQMGKKPYSPRTEEDGFFSQFKGLFDIKPGRYALNDSGMTTAQKALAIGLVAGIAAVGAYAYVNHMNEMKEKAKEASSQKCIVGHYWNECDWDHDGILNDDEENIYHTNPHSLDTDGDMIMDNVEIFEIHSDPTKYDTHGDGISDFVKYVIYPDYIKPEESDPAYWHFFKKQMPDVKARPFYKQLRTLACIKQGPTSCPVAMNDNAALLERVKEISMQDPLLQYYANKVDMILPDNEMPGKFLLDGESILRNKEESSQGDLTHIPCPSYFLSTANRNGTVKDALVTSGILLKMNGYNSTLKINTEPIEGCRHCCIPSENQITYWLEFDANKKTYVMQENDIYEKEAFLDMIVSEKMAPISKKLREDMEKPSVSIVF